MNSTHFNLDTTLTNNKPGNCTQLLRVFGKGVKDKFAVDCNNNFYNYIGFTSISSEDYVVYINGDQKLLLFTDTPSTLIVFKNGTCARRTYTTTGRVTTFTEEPMMHSECVNQLQKMEQAKQDWTRRFNDQMMKVFPPCFPFCFNYEPPYPFSRRKRSKGKKKSKRKPAHKNKSELDVDEWNL